MVWGLTVVYQYKSLFLGGNGKKYLNWIYLLSGSSASVLKTSFKNVRNGYDQVTFLDFIMFSLLIWELSKLEAEQALKYLTRYLINNNC